MTLRILFLCTGNSARSQMAEHLLRQAGKGQFDVRSAGTVPAGVHPLTVRVLNEVGIDVSGSRSKSVDEFAVQQFDYVITVCDRARDQCPVFPGDTRRIHWSFEDPAAANGNADEQLRMFRRIRTEIATRIRNWIPAVGKVH